MNDKSAFITQATAAWAGMIVRHPGRVLLTLLALFGGSLYLTSQLTIESDQLSLISQDLQEVKDVKRVIDMVGGAGYLAIGLRSDDVPALKKAGDALNDALLAHKQPDGSPSVRFVTYKVPVEFIQENMILFIKTEDLVEAKRRINLYLKDQIRRANPFFIEIKKTEPVKLELDDLIAKYSSVGKKSIKDSYYISNDGKMLMMLVKPMWNSTELQKTKAFIDDITGEAKTGQPLTKGLLADVAKKTGLALVEDYKTVGDAKTVYFGFTGSYKLGLDDSYAIQESIDDVSLVALGLVVVITLAFFRRWAPTVIVMLGLVMGTIMAMGFAKLTLGQLNMVTSMIGAILMGLGIDFGIHFMFRTRIELGMGKKYDLAIRDALINAGRPALVASIVTAGSFFVLLFSGFRGFSQFGFLSGFGTIIIGFTLFSWSPSVLLLLGRKNPEWPKKLVGSMTPPSQKLVTGATRVPAPKLLLSIAVVIVAVVCAFAVPWTDFDAPTGRKPTMWERFKGGVQFNYNTRALIPESQTSIKLQDEINERFQISSDPIAVPTETLDDAKAIWYEMTKNPEYDFNVDSDRFHTVDQVVSIYSFVPPPKTAAANAKVLAEWREELKDIDVASLPPEMQEKAGFFKKVLEKQPYDVKGVPRVYAEMFESLPTTKPENRGYLTFLYPKVDLWDGKNLMRFAEETGKIHTANGKTYRSAGLATLYAKLAQIVLFDGKLTVALAALWILLMHYLDFRSVKLAAASVIPLGVGLVMLLGILSIVDHRLNFMNLVILPILLGFGVSHGLYLLHRFLEGTSPLVALRSVGAAVASSTLTTVAGFASLFFAQHNGLQSVGFVACVGLLTTLVVSFTVLAAVLQLIHDHRSKEEKEHLTGGATEPAAPAPAEPST